MPKLLKLDIFRVSDIVKTDYAEWYLINFFDTDKVKIMEFTQNKDRNKILYSGVVFVNKYEEKITALTNQKADKKSKFSVLIFIVSTFKSK